MLVPKKAPGEWRMIVETRHVNKVYEPVGGMSAATLDNKSRGWSQYIYLPRLSANTPSTT